MTFEWALALADISADEGTAVTIGDHDVVGARGGDGDDTQVVALQDRCSHEEIPLSDGEVDGCEIECCLHGSMFDLRSGKPTNLPATEPVATFPVELRPNEAGGTDVYVDTTTTLNGVTPS